MRWTSLVVSVTLTSLLATSLVCAESHKPLSFGIGWYSGLAPLGGRLWLTNRIGVDLGAGFFNYTEEDFQSSFMLNIGVPIDLVQTEHVNLYVRPGYQLDTSGRSKWEDGAAEYESQHAMTADIAVEWFITRRFSLGAGYGIVWEQSNQIGEGSVVKSQAFGIENIGFHFYF